MPKSTFNNLPAERRLLIAMVALDEFSAQPVYEASVASIIERLSIARGTFYKYFTDLKELYLYLYCETHLQEDALLREIIQKKRGLRQAYECYFEAMSEELFDELHEYRRMVRLSMNALLRQEIEQYRREHNILPVTDDLPHEIIELTHQVLVRGLEQNMTKEAIRQDFREILDSYQIK